MIDADTITRLRTMRLSGMADCFDHMAWTGQTAMTGPDLVKLAVDSEWERRRTSRLARLRRAAQLAQPHADIADIQPVPQRRLDTEFVARLATGGYITRHEDVIIQGPTGSGKTYLACALGNRACQQYRKVLYLPAAELFDRLTLADNTGQRPQVMRTLATIELLIIDDWFLTSPTSWQVQQLHTLIDRRHRATSTIYCTQLPPAHWHDRMDEKILADAIVDRITTNAHTTIIDSANSMRRHFTQLDG